MKDLLLKWLMMRARQCTALGWGNEAALFEKAAGILKGIKPELFVVHPKLAAVMEAMDRPPADASAAVDVDAAVAEIAAEDAAVVEKHAEAVALSVIATPSDPPSTAPAGPAPDKIPEDAPALSPAEMAAKLAPKVDQ